MPKSILKNWSGTAAVIGVDWGDSGKGRLIDDMAQRADIVARYGGGSNTGHTIENKYGKFALHIVPSGIFNKNTTCLIGRNVAVDLESLSEEIKNLQNSGVSCNNIIIDPQASLTMPWHKLRDGKREKSRKNKVGTTGKGIGPTYADRTERVGLLVKDLFRNDFKEILKQELTFQNNTYNLDIKFTPLLNEYTVYAARFKKFVKNTNDILNQSIKSKKNILFEGAQGIFLDIDVGTYPFVTSSNPGVIGISRSFDILPHQIGEVIGISKAYTTRVGEGPMPTEIKNAKTANYIIETGKEMGATTGRVRRPGWLDLALIKFAIKTNNLTGLAITKLDILSGLKNIKICIGYSANGKKINYPAHDSETFSKCKPIYKILLGWEEDISNVRNFKDLPKNSQIFIKEIEKICNIPVKFISVGPKRGQVIYV